MTPSLASTSRSRTARQWPSSAPPGPASLPSEKCRTGMYDVARRGEPANPLAAWLPIDVVGRRTATETHSRNRGQVTRATGEPHGAPASRSTVENRLEISSPILTRATSEQLRGTGFAGAQRAGRCFGQRDDTSRTWAGGLTKPGVIPCIPTEQGRGRRHDRFPWAMGERNRRYPRGIVLYRA
jgi:hypothetical protein